MAWSDERLDDLSKRIDERFDGVDRGLERIDQRFDRIEDSIAALDARIHGDMNDLRNVFLRVGGGVILALVGVIGAVVAAG